MSRTAEDILEFDRLRDLLRRQTTCAPGRRAVDALSFSQDRSALEAAFALIAEAVAYLGDGNEMGFGSLADPARWLAELEAPAEVLTPLMLLEAASLADTAAMLRDSFPESAGAGAGPAARQFPLLSARATRHRFHHTAVAAGADGKSCRGEGAPEFEGFHIIRMSILWTRTSEHRDDFCFRDHSVSAFQGLKASVSGG